MERIPADSWSAYEDHTWRYAYAQEKVRAGEEVNDIACGVGYGATFFTHAQYRGYDKPGVPAVAQFPGTFYAADLDNPAWKPESADITVCFETIEHVLNPVHLASVITNTTRRAIILSVPLYPKEQNPFHLTDFVKDEVPSFFPGFHVTEDRGQPGIPGWESWIWFLERAS